jgi:hypothetical protein
MGHFFSKICCAVLVVSALLVPSSTPIQAHQKTKKKEKPVPKDVMNFDGGIFFETDGSVSDITCFRLEGRVTSEHFFDSFKRIDDANGTHYRRGQETLTEFPEEVRVSLLMVDFPCPGQLQQSGPRRYLTKEMMLGLRFSFYWKRGLELRHIDDIKHESATAEPVEPYNTQNKEELAKRYRWYLEFSIPSAGVPLTDRIVLIVRTPDGRTAARVAARL